MSSRIPMGPPEEPVPEVPSEAPKPSRQELDRSVLSGIAWNGGLRSLTITMSWIVGLFVVRLLTPADYGLVAMAGAYIGLVDMFGRFGLGAAIVQRRNLTESQIARLGGASILASAILAVFSVSVSGFVAGYFDEPRVQPIVIVMSITFVLSGAGVVPSSLLARDLQFKTEAWIGACRNLTYTVTSLLLALSGFGYWSLVLAALLGQAVRVVVAVIVRPHRIAWPRELASIKSELWFGSHVTVSQFALYIRRFADILVVGRVLGTGALGAYNVAWQQANAPADRVGPIASRVSPATLASVQHDRGELRRYLRMFTEGIAMLTFPAAFGLSVVADDFVLLVFGERWAASVMPLRVLALVAAMRSVTPILSQVLVATDQTKLNMRFTLVGAVLIPGFLIVGVRWGITGVAVGWLIGHPISMGFVLLRYALREAEMTFGQYFATLRPAVSSGLVMVLVVLLLKGLMPPEWTLFTRFALEVGAGALTYVLVILTVYRGRVDAAMRMVRSARRAGTRDAR